MRPSNLHPSPSTSSTSKWATKIFATIFLIALMPIFIEQVDDLLSAWNIQSAFTTNIFHTLDNFYAVIDPFLRLGVVAALVYLLFVIVKWLRKK